MALVPEHGGLSLEPVLSSSAGSSPRLQSFEG